MLLWTSHAHGSISPARSVAVDRLVDLAISTGPLTSCFIHPEPSLLDHWHLVSSTKRDWGDVPVAARLLQGNVRKVKSTLSKIIWALLVDV